MFEPRPFNCIDSVNVLHLDVVHRFSTKVLYIEVLYIGVVHRGLNLNRGVDTH